MPDEDDKGLSHFLKLKSHMENETITIIDVYDSTIVDNTSHMSSQPIWKGKGFIVNSPANTNRDKMMLLSGIITKILKWALIS